MSDYFPQFLAGKIRDYILVDGNAMLGEGIARFGSFSLNPGDHVVKQSKRGNTIAEELLKVAGEVGEVRGTGYLGVEVPDFVAIAVRRVVPSFLIKEFVGLSQKASASFEFSEAASQVP